MILDKKINSNDTENTYSNLVVINISDFQEIFNFNPIFNISLKKVDADSIKP